MRKIKELFKNKKAVVCAAITLCLISGIAVGGYVVNTASANNNTNVEDTKTAKTAKREKGNDKMTLSSLIDSGEKSSSKADSSAKSSSSKSGSASSYNSNGSSENEVIKRQAACNHEWVYYKNNGLDICSKCGAERTTQHQHTWEIMYVPIESEAVNICRNCLTHYQANGCPNCGCGAFATTEDVTCYAVLRYCTSCGYEEVIDYEYYDITYYNGMDCWGHAH